MLLLVITSLPIILNGCSERRISTLFLLFIIFFNILQNFFIYHTMFHNISFVFFLSYFAGLIERMELRGNRFLEEARDHGKLKITWKKIFES